MGQVGRQNPSTHPCMRQLFRLAKINELDKNGSGKEKKAHQVTEEEEGVCFLLLSARQKCASPLPAQPLFWMWKIDHAYIRKGQARVLHSSHSRSYNVYRTTCIAVIEMTISSHQYDHIVISI